MPTDSIVFDEVPVGRRMLNGEAGDHQIGASTITQVVGSLPASEPSLLERRRLRYGSNTQVRTPTEPIQVPLASGRDRLPQVDDGVQFYSRNTESRSPSWLPEMSPFGSTFSPDLRTPVGFKDSIAFENLVQDREEPCLAVGPNISRQYFGFSHRSPSSPELSSPPARYSKAQPGDRSPSRPTVQIPQYFSNRRISSIPEGETTREFESPEDSPSLPSALPSPGWNATSEPASFADGPRWGSSRRANVSQRVGTSYAGEGALFGWNRRRRASSRKSSTASASPAGSFLNSLANFGQQAPNQPDDEGQYIGDYTLGKQIGFGGFSIVREAIYPSGPKKIRRAVKIVRRVVDRKNAVENDNIQRQFGREVVLWRRLNHRNILPLLTVYETSFATYAISPLNTGGTLFDLVNKERSGLQDRTIQWYAYQLAEAIRYLHVEARVVHRDIKLENCLIDTGVGGSLETAKLLLCDFGLAEFLDDDEQQPDVWTTNHHPGLTVLEAKVPATENTAFTFTGSLQYASPELVASGTVYGLPVHSFTASDIWAFGVILYTLTVGYLPFQHTLPAKVYQLILRGQYDRSALISADSKRNFGGLVVACVEACFKPATEDRPSIATLMNMPFLVSAFDSHEREG